MNKQLTRLFAPVVLTVPMLLGGCASPTQYCPAGDQTAQTIKSGSKGEQELKKAGATVLLANPVTAIPAQIAMGMYSRQCPNNHLNIK